MGILDDAIREHLDLKRRQGVEEGELAKLEDEAFGPPTRPGDPDFPQEQPDTGTATAVAEPETGEAPAAAAPETSEAPVAEPPEAAEPTAQEPAAEAPPAASGFYDHAGDEPPEPAIDPEPTPPPAEPASDAPDPEPGAEPAPDPEPTPVPEPAPEPTQGAPVEPPIESLDTVEHHVEGAIEDTGEAEVVEAELVEEEETPEGDDEDVLEETPEFLRDQPEDDELWFEQGEPKDFDF